MNDQPRDDAIEARPDAALLRDAIRAKTTAARLKAIYQEDRIQAAEALASMGVQAEAAVPMLIEALDDREAKVAAAVAQALARIGPVAVEPLVAALLDDQYQYRLPVIVALGELGPDAAPAVRHLMDVLRSEDEAAQREAVRSLGQIGSAARAALPALRLSEKNESLRLLAQRTIQRIEGQGQLAEYFQWNLMVVLAAAAAALGALTVLHWGQQAMAMQGAGRIPALIAFGWGLIGGTLGGIIGGHSSGKIGAVKGAVLFGVGGALIGGGIGTVIALVLDPLGKAMGGK